MTILLELLEFSYYHSEYDFHLISVKTEACSSKL